MNDEHDTPNPDMQGVFVDLAAAELEPPRWVVRNVLPVGLHVLVGPPKSQKSTVTLALAALVAGFDCHALPFFMSQVEKPGPVLLFSYEALAGEIKYIIERDMNTPVHAGSIWVVDDPWLWRLDDKDGMRRLLKWLDVLDPRVLILDTFRHTHDLREDDSGEMHRMLRPLRAWAIKTDSSVVLVHHTRKMSGDDIREGRDYTANDARGSSAVFGLCDGMTVFSPKNDGSVVLDATFKRGASWNRRVKFGAYGETAAVMWTDIDRACKAAVEACPGIHTDDLVEQLGKPRVHVVSSLRTLEVSGLITERDGTWKPRSA